MTAITFASVCSGIEAASVAWGPLGWRAAWLAEIEAFPAAVLAHHYPDVPNLGDMTTIARRVLTGEVPAPDVLAGGTPCQAFSVAGLRNSLADARGNLTLKFVELADAIDHVRQRAGKTAAGIFWENVPGVLSTKDNAFGCFLAGLAGFDDPIQPPGPAPKPGRPPVWAPAGAVYGPSRAVAWRTLDAQYFGLAQRRRRVFVVASARGGFDPAQVLFEWQGLRRDTAPRRGSPQDVAPTVSGGARQRGGYSTDDIPIAGTLNAGMGRRSAEAPERDLLQVVGALTAACGPNGHGGSGLATDKGAEAGRILAFGGNRTSAPLDVAAALLSQPGSGYKGDFETETFITHSLRGEGFDASEYGTGRGTPLVPVAYSTKLHNTTSNQSGKCYENYTASLDANSPPPAIVFDTTQISSATNRSNPQPGDPFHTLAGAAHPPAIAFPANLSGTQSASTEELAPAMGAKNPTAVAFSCKDHGADASNDFSPTLRAMGHAGSHANAGGQVAVHYATQVRRLTPRECERLQGFPDDYTEIPWRGKPASECPDGPRYKAIGNSWPIPVVRWIGARLDAAINNSTDQP